MNIELPPVSMQPISHIDLTPTPDLALRILTVYRQNCDVRWVTTETENPIFKMMNEACDKRAKILDEAIAKLAREAV